METRLLDGNEMKRLHLPLRVKHDLTLPWNLLLQRDVTGSIPCFFEFKNGPPVIGVRGYPLSHTLDMGEPEDDLPSDPVVGGLS